MALSIIILAAGQGTRMRSSLPKVLHKLADRPMLEHVIDCAESIGANQIRVVYGHGGEQVISAASHRSVEWFEQKEQLGTGHAVAQALDGIPDEDILLILYGDVPLIGHATLTRLHSLCNDQTMGLLTARLDDATGYGRIIRNEQGQVTGIVEHKDASEEQRQITEVNTGFMAATAKDMKRWIGNLGSDNVQGEYYLTDVIAMAAADGIEVSTEHPDYPEETFGVNDRIQLAYLERYYQKQQAIELMMAGVALRDPARIDVRGIVSAGQDVEIDINVILAGNVVIGNNVRIGANCVIRNSVIEDDVVILENCVIEDAKVGHSSKIGPFARLRPEANLADHVHVGNFVEIKKSDVGSGSKVNHLSYIGDTTIGQRVNIGAGTITCNYDGANKHRTIIGDDVFIGSDTQLVAPVTVGDKATVGAGATITGNVPEGMLSISRVSQKNIGGWKRPVKKK